MKIKIDPKLVLLLLGLSVALFCDIVLAPFGLFWGSIMFLVQLLVGTVIVYKGLTSS